MKSGRDYMVEGDGHGWRSLALTMESRKWSSCGMPAWNTPFPIPFLLVSSAFSFFLLLHDSLYPFISEAEIA